MEQSYGATNAIDNNWRTKSISVYGGDWRAGTWMTVNLGGVYCVETVEVWYYLQLPR